MVRNKVDGWDYLLVCWVCCWSSSSVNPGNQTPPAQSTTYIHSSCLMIHTPARCAPTQPQRLGHISHFHHLSFQYNTSSYGPVPWRRNLHVCFNVAELFRADFVRKPAEQLVSPADFPLSLQLNTLQTHICEPNLESAPRRREASARICITPPPRYDQSLSSEEQQSRCVKRWDSDKSRRNGFCLFTLIKQDEDGVLLNEFDTVNNSESLRKWRLSSKLRKFNQISRSTKNHQS